MTPPRETHPADRFARERLRAVLGFPQPVETIESPKRGTTIDLRDRPSEDVQARLDALTDDVRALRATLDEYARRVAYALLSLPVVDARDGVAAEQPTFIGFDREL